MASVIAQPELTNTEATNIDTEAERDAWTTALQLDTTFASRPLYIPAGGPDYTIVPDWNQFIIRGEEYSYDPGSGPVPVPATNINIVLSPPPPSLPTTPMTNVPFPGQTLWYVDLPSSTVGLNVIRESDSSAVPFDFATTNYPNTFVGTQTFTGDVDVTGDLTVDTDTLHVDSTNNRVGIRTTSPYSDFDALVTGGRVTMGSAYTYSFPLAIYPSVANSGRAFAIKRNDTTTTDALVISIDGATPTFSTTNAGYVFNAGGATPLTLTTTGDAIVAGDLTVDTSTLHVDSTNNRVGIGTASPDTLLTIYDGGAATDQIKLGASNSLYYDIGRSTSTGNLVFRGRQIGVSAFDFLAWDGAKKIRITNQGDIEFASGAVSFDSNSGTWDGSIFGGAQSFQSTVDVTGDFTVNTDKLFVDVSTDKVGIGTASPDANLTVEGTDGLTIRKGAAYNNTGETGSPLMWRGTAGPILNRIQPYASITNKYGFKFDTYTTNTITTKMTLDGDGNLGIGTTTPDTTLHVLGSTTLEGGFITPTTSVTATPHAASTATTVLLVDDDTAGGAVTINLPAAATAGDGFTYYIKKIGNTGNVIIDGSGAETIDGSATATMTTQYESITIICDGTEWLIL